MPPQDPPGGQPGPIYDNAMKLIADCDLPALRLRQANPATPIAQYVLALGDISVPEHYRDIGAGQLLCTWTVVRLSDLDPAALLGSPATAALAALGSGTTEQRTAVLAAAIKLVNTCDDPRRRHDLLAAAAILASIVLTPGTIVTALKGADMPILFS
ncbi:MAG: hypothetical protein M3257_06940, partial [Actinomycetota bacterium]|nr:hypothetical protein [Actinomycetota bacterium]